MADFPVERTEENRKEPAIIRAGDTVAWHRLFDHRSSTDFDLSYVLVSKKDQYTFTAEESSVTPDAFFVKVPAATTAGWVPGRYRWEAYLKNEGGDRETIDQGELTIMPNLETATGGFDDRDQDEKILDAIRNLIAGKVTEDAQRYVIHGRELQRYTFAELEELRCKYALRVRRKRVQRGERVSSRTVRTAFLG